MSTQPFIESTLVGIQGPPGSLTPKAPVAVTGNKTLALADAETQQIASAAAVVTIPANATVAFEVGASVRLIRNTSGAVSWLGAAGVTVNGVVAGSVAITAQHKSAVATKVGTNSWIVEGAV